jgi:hypothetical protein
MRFIGAVLLLAAAIPASDAFLAPASSLLRSGRSDAAVARGRFAAPLRLQRRAAPAGLPLRMSSTAEEVDYQAVTVDNIRNCAIIAHVWIPPD